MTESNAENNSLSSHDAEWHSKKSGLSRRDFLKLGLGAAGAFALEKATGGLLRVEAQTADETTNIYASLFTKDEAKDIYAGVNQSSSTPTLIPTATPGGEMSGLPKFKDGSPLETWFKTKKDYTVSGGNELKFDNVQSPEDLLKVAGTFKLVPIPLTDGTFSMQAELTKDTPFKYTELDEKTNTRVPKELTLPALTTFVFNPGNESISVSIPDENGGKPTVFNVDATMQAQITKEFAKTTAKGAEVAVGTVALGATDNDGNLLWINTTTEAAPITKGAVKITKPIYRAGKEASAKLTNEAFMASYKFKSGDDVELIHKGNTPNSNKDWKWRATTNGQTYDNLPVFEIKAFNEVKPLESMTTPRKDQTGARVFNGAGIYLGSEIKTRMVTNKETDMLEVTLALPSQDGKDTLIVRLDTPADINVGFSDDGGGMNVIIPGKQAFEKMQPLKSGWQINFQSFEKVPAAAILKVFNTNEQGCDQNGYCRYLLATLASNQFTNIADISAWQKASPAQRAEIKKGFVLDPDGTVVSSSASFITLASVTWQPS